MNENYFTSSDLALCAALCCYGYAVQKVDKSNPAKVVFTIKSDNKLEQTIQYYWEHKLKVDPLSFFNCLRALKSRIYNL